MWTANYYIDKVDIVPDGEEDMHVPEAICPCLPRLGRSNTGLLMISHNSFDGREFFEKAEAELQTGFRYKRAA